MPGRRASQRRVEERVKSGETTTETGGSQQPSKRREQGRGHSKHTASTTPPQSTGQGGTRGTDGEPDHAPRHTPHRHNTHRTHPHRRPTARGQRAPAARPDGGQPRKGGRLNPEAPHHPCGAQPPTGHASHGASAGPPHRYTRAHSTWVVDPDSPPGGRAVGGGGEPDPRRPSKRWKAPPPGTPFSHPHSAQHRPARAHAVGPLLGSHVRIHLGFYGVQKRFFGDGGSKHSISCSKTLQNTFF